MTVSAALPGNLTPCDRIVHVKSCKKSFKWAFSACLDVEKAYFTIKFMEVRNMAQPEKRFKAGSCEAAVFENELTRDGQTV